MKFVIRVVGALGLMALAGCMQVFPTVQGSELASPSPTGVEQVVELPEQPTEVIEEGGETIPATEEIVPTGTAEVSSTEASLVPTEGISETVTVVPPTEVPTESTVLGSTELRATNPANVNLASGKVQLVEFFAFW